MLVRLPNWRMFESIKTNCSYNADARIQDADERKVDLKITLMTPRA